MKSRYRKGISHTIETDQFTQAFKETNVPTDYLLNPDIIKPMQRPGKISTTKPVLADKVSDDNDDDRGFRNFRVLAHHKLLLSF